MTDELFRNNSYLKEYEVTVTEVTSDGLVFDKTIFYPEGGGQPGDEGFITSGENKARILGTKYINQKLVHLEHKKKCFALCGKPF